MLRFLFSALMLITITQSISAAAPTRAEIDIWRYGGPYGVYCGIFHTSLIFERPVDEVDRMCQLHDTCISAAGKYLSCECNEQLARRMSDVCITNQTALVYRDEIIRAMMVGTSLCGSATCGLLKRYDVSAEVGFNAVIFYGPGNVTLSTGDDGGILLLGRIPSSRIVDFGILNIAGRPPLDDFKKSIDGVHALSSDETLVIFNPNGHSAAFHGRVDGLWSF
jgi:hypothetical protein